MQYTIYYVLYVLRSMYIYMTVATRLFTLRTIYVECRVDYALIPTVLRCACALLCLGKLYSSFQPCSRHSAVHAIEREGQ